MSRHRISMSAINGRVQKMLIKRAKFEADIDNVHVRIQPGNSKTGRLCATVSLIPIADCTNCSGCKGDCYDVRNVCFQPVVQEDRARNSAIHRFDPARYWQEISYGIKYNAVMFLRLNVGGDLTDKDFAYVAWLGKENPRTNILFFTKNDVGINTFLDKAEFPVNVHPILSAWPGVPMENPHNLPVAHVLWEDGTTTAPEYGAIYCGGNCSQCALNEGGCWTLEKGGHVIFKAH